MIKTKSKKQKTKTMAGQNIFNSVKLTKPGKNVFDLSHDVKFSLDMGILVPTLCMECVPGDKFNISCESLLRFQPLTAPVMHRIDQYMHYFFVPTRLLWPNWEKFITNTPLTPGGALPAVPTVDITQLNYSPLADYLGLPLPPAGGLEKVSAFPFAAYQSIYNEYYRDQNLIPESDWSVVDGDNTPTFLSKSLHILRRRAWEHDYFTSALPFAQKGNPVTLPIGTFNDVPVVAQFAPQAGDTTVNFQGQGQPSGINGAYGVTIDPTQPNPLMAKTSQLGATSSTINDLRTAFKLQEWLEKAARGGSRLVENILVQFGVRSPDKRLQRPEYITGTKTPCVISEVLNTSDTANAAQGEMAGHGIAVTSGGYGSYFCEEHGYIIGIMSVMPKTSYGQGIEKHWLKRDPFDYYWPSFANLGEQEIVNREIMAFQGPALGDAVFGYTPRYAEYKFMQNRIAGDFRTTLDFWHMTREFLSQPTLSQGFVECDPREDIFAVNGPATPHKLLCQILHKIKAIRPMPKYGTPTF